MCVWSGTHALQVPLPVSLRRETVGEGRSGAGESRGGPWAFAAHDARTTSAGVVPPQATPTATGAGSGAASVGGGLSRVERDSVFTCKRASLPQHQEAGSRSGEKQRQRAPYSSTACISSEDGRRSRPRPWRARCAPDEADAGPREELPGRALLEGVAAGAREGVVGEEERVGLAVVGGGAGAAWGRGRGLRERRVMRRMTVTCGLGSGGDEDWSSGNEGQLMRGERFRKSARGRKGPVRGKSLLAYSKPGSRQGAPMASSTVPGGAPSC